MPKDSPIASVADLKGKKVALNKGSNVHYLLVRALETAGLAYGDIEPVYLPPADARAAFERGAVDAWAIWDPFLAAAQAATGARTLADGTGLVSNHQFYLARAAFADRPAGDSSRRSWPTLAEVDHWASRPIRRRSRRLLRRASGIPAPVLEVALERLGYGVQPLARRGRGRAAEDRRHLPQAWACCPSRSRSRRRSGSASSHERMSRTTDVLWFLPTHGDSRYLGTSEGAREVDLHYLRQIAQAADDLGYYGVLLPTGRSCEDAWVVASA